MTRARPRRWSLLGCLLALLGLKGARAQTAPEPLERVRVNYVAPPECPGPEAFLELVRARIGGAWEAPPNELARSIDVRITTDGARSVARIDFVDDRGAPVTRSVGAETCPEVVSGIALVTALAIESRVASEATREAAPAASVPPPSTPPPNVEAQSRPTPGAPASGAGAEPPHFDVGGAFAAFPGIGPAVAWVGPRGFVGLGWEGGPDFRLGIEGAWATVDAFDSRFSLLGGSLDGCPFVVRLGSRVRFLPCAGVVGGVIDGQGSGDSGAEAYEPGGAAAPWFAVRAFGRAEASLELLFVEVVLEGRFPTGYPRFAIEGAGPGDPSRTVYELPPALLGAALGVGLRL